MLISPNCVRGTTIAGAKPGSLFIADDKDRSMFAIGTGKNGGETVAVALSGPNAFKSFETRGNTAWDGLELSQIKYEIDYTSGAQILSQPVGSLVVIANTLIVIGFAEMRYQPYSVIVAKLSNENAQADDQAICFSIWRIALKKSDDEIIELFTTKPN